MAGARTAGQTDPERQERHADHTRIAGCAAIVLDASAAVELLTNGPMADSPGRELAVRGGQFAAPHLLDVEVMSALRKLIGGQRVDSHRSEQFLAALTTLPVERYSHLSLLGRIRELRRHFTAYDAACIALAEATESILYTCDSKLCKGHRAKVRLFSHV